MWFAGQPQNYPRPISFAKWPPESRFLLLLECSLLEWSRVSGASRAPCPFQPYPLLAWSCFQALLCQRTDAALGTMASNLLLKVTFKFLLSVPPGLISPEHLLIAWPKTVFHMQFLNHLRTFTTEPRWRPQVQQQQNVQVRYYLLVVNSFGMTFHLGQNLHSFIYQLSLAEQALNLSSPTSLLIKWE